MLHFVYAVIYVCVCIYIYIFVYVDCICICGCVLLFVCFYILVQLRSISLINMFLSLFSCFNSLHLGPMFGKLHPKSTCKYFLLPMQSFHNFCDPQFDVLNCIFCIYLCMKFIFGCSKQLCWNKFLCLWLFCRLKYLGLWHYKGQLL